MSVIIGGTIAIDNVKTPTAAANNLLGGSAAYASLSASYYSKPVHLVGIIGRDYPQQHLDMLESHGVTLEGVERSDSESFTWTGEYMENMNDRETHAVALNVLETWKVKVPQSIADAQLVVLANMSPENQLQMLEQCNHPQKFVIADTMDLWITIAQKQLREVLKQINILVLNESEARLLTENSNLIQAGLQLLEMGPEYVIIKLGEFGAILFAPDGKMFKLHAWPLTCVADPTGAGDTFLGGMAGFLDGLDTETYGFDEIKQGMARGSVLASYTCEAFSTCKLQEISAKDIDSRLLALQQLGSW